MAERNMVVALTFSSVKPTVLAQNVSPLAAGVVLLATNQLFVVMAKEPAK